MQGSREEAAIKFLVDQQTSEVRGASDVTDKVSEAVKAVLRSDAMWLLLTWEAIKNLPPHTI